GHQLCLSHNWLETRCLLQLELLLLFSLQHSLRCQSNFEDASDPLDRQSQRCDEHSTGNENGVAVQVDAGGDQTTKSTRIDKGGEGSCAHEQYQGGSYARHNNG